MTALAFHLAAPIRDIEETREFYTKLLDCRVGREAETWIDLDFYGHQLSFHVKPDELTDVKANQVDGKDVPVRHFGAILEWESWQSLSKKLVAHGMIFVIDPYIRFAGETGEQATMFFHDPSGNALEFKAFKNPDQIFAR